MTVRYFGRAADAWRLMHGGWMQCGWMHGGWMHANGVEFDR